MWRFFARTPVAHKPPSVDLRIPLNHPQKDLIWIPLPPFPGRQQALNPPKACCMHGECATGYMLGKEMCRINSCLLVTLC